jgi:hypothetical protein
MPNESRNLEAWPKHTIRWKRGIIDKDKMEEEGFKQLEG